MRAEEPDITPKEVAEWMIAWLDEHEVLKQQAAAALIQGRFGAEFVYRDPYGYLAISRKVLYQFRKLTADSVVWEVRDGNWLDGWWRLRRFGDTPWRRQLSATSRAD